MAGVAIGFAFFAAYIALIVAILRWARRRLLQRAQAAANALEASGATIHSVTPSPRWGAPAVVEFELDGERGRFHVRRYNRDWVLLSVHVDCHPLPSILVRIERAADRMGKALGLNREVQIGDAAFDDAAYILSNASDDIVREMLGTPEIRSAVTAILALGYRVDMSGDGLRATRLQYGLDAFDPAPVPGVMRALEALAPLLPKIDPAKIVNPPVQRLSRVVIASTVFAFLAATTFFVTVRSMRPPVDDLNSVKAIGIGILFWIVVVILLGRSMRARSTGMLELGLSALALFFGVPFASAALLFFVNAGLDSSAATTHTTKVLSVQRSGGDNDLRVVPWDPTRTWQKVGVDFATWKTLHADDAVEVDVHPGTLAWPWVSGVRKAP